MFLLSSSSSFATVTVLSVNGDSAHDLSVVTSPVIFGGTAGPECTGATSSETCNNCSTADTACNPKRIYNNLMLTITFKSDTKSGYPMMTKSDGTTLIDSESQSINAGTEISYQVRWGDICEIMNSGTTTGDTSCDTEFTGTVRVGVSKELNSTLTDSDDDSVTITLRVHGNQRLEGYDVHEDCANTGDGEEGICHVEFTEGDEKVYILSADSVFTSFPNTSNGISYTALRIVFSETSDDASFSLLGDNVYDLKIDSKSTNAEVFLEQNYVPGLTNGLNYYIKYGTVDAAGNVGFFSPSVSGPFRPEEVLGLLSDDLNCFIATAAFGSPFAPAVKTLREFRNRFLLPHHLGKKLTSFYYHYSPPIAQFIKIHSWLKSPVRLLLTPVWLFAELTLHWGITPLIWFYTFIIIIISFFLFYKNRIHSL